MFNWCLNVLQKIIIYIIILPIIINSLLLFIDCYLSIYLLLGDVFFHSSNNVPSRIFFSSQRYRMFYYFECDSLIGCRRER